jgi:S-formylglutathione hydrolase FrmB
MTISARSSALGCSITVLLLALTVATAVGQTPPTVAELLRIKWVNPPISPPQGVRHATFHSKAVGAEVGYNVYLPDAYEKEPNRRFPTVYFLHGSGGHESRNVDLAAYMHRAIAAGNVEPMLMVFVNGGHNSGYQDSVDGTLKVETMLMEELIPHVDATYRTVADRKGRAIEGFSMGGGGALRLALKYPERFSSVVVYGAGGMRAMETMPTTEDIQSPGDKRRKMRIRRAVMGDDLEHWRRTNSYYILEQNAERIRGQVGIRLVIGTEDFSLEGAHAAQDRFDELKIPHEYELIGGVKHDIRVLYRRAGLRGLQFHERWFGGDSRPGTD